MRKLTILAILGSIAMSRTSANDISMSSSRASVFVDDSLLTLTGDCHTYTTKDSCVANQCYWCKSAAVRSMCYTEDESQQLPPGVFECDKKESVISWTLTSLPNDTETWLSLFTSWKRAQNKQYESAIEEEMRRAVFEENARIVVAHNRDEHATFTMELNQFADITWEEFKQWYLGAPQNCSATHNGPTKPLLYSNVPEAKDWRDLDIVSPVKNQGKCGSCWTFSTTGALESHYKLKHGGAFVLLSEQNLIDCAQAFDNHGCNGGLPFHAFEYVHYNGGLDTEETYPYHGIEEKCKFNTYHIGVKVESSVNITALNEHELKGAVGTVGPVSVAFQVSSDFRFYKSGVYSSKQCKSGVTDVNHAVLAVGYGTVVATNQPYWIIKNSWGVTWGMAGFFQIERNSNMCGIADCASYPNVE